MTLVSPRINVSIRQLKPNKPGVHHYARLRRAALVQDPDCFANTLAEEELSLCPENVAGFLEGNLAIAAYAGSRPVGLAVSSVRGPSRLRHVCEIGRVYVCSKMRGQGIARQIILAQCGLRHGEGYKTIVASVSAANQPSLKAFAAAGFTEYGRLPDEFMTSQGPVAGVHLSRRLAEELNS